MCHRRPPVGGVGEMYALVQCQRRKPSGEGESLRYIRALRTAPLLARILLNAFHIFFKYLPYVGIL